jgi:hypothetical protein
MCSTPHSPSAAMHCSRPAARTRTQNARRPSSKSCMRPCQPIPPPQRGHCSSSAYTCQPLGGGSVALATMTDWTTDGRILSSLVQLQSLSCKICKSCTAGYMQLLCPIIIGACPIIRATCTAKNVTGYITGIGTHARPSTHGPMSCCTCPERGSIVSC